MRPRQPAAAPMLPSWPTCIVLALLAGAAAHAVSAQNTTTSLSAAALPAATLQQQPQPPPLQPTATATGPIPTTTTAAVAASAAAATAPQPAAPADNNDVDAAAAAAGVVPPPTLPPPRSRASIPTFPPAPPHTGVSSAGRTDGTDELTVRLLPGAIPRLQQILSEVVANATALTASSSSSGNATSGLHNASAVLDGQDVAAAEAGGFVVARGTQFFRDGRPFYFVGGNAYWFVDLYTLDWGRGKIEEFLDTCKALGVSVIRTWAFNDGMPKAFDRYDARQLAGLHYVIWAAKVRGLLLTLTLGNLWPAYKGPEEFLEMATGSAANKDVLDFYGDPATRALYKLHVWGLLTTPNRLTGLAPRDDPAIFSWNIINEPRCPGCFTADQQAVHQGWLRDVASFVRAVAPRQLISASTEGFFVQDGASMLHYYNPGPGAQCDGEDWFAISALPQLDYTTIHVYERHMELQPRPSGNPGWPNWIHCGFDCYSNWFRMYTQLHTYLSATVLRKPLVLEEFGLTWFKQPQDRQRVLFQVASDMLLDSARHGGALAGIMPWNAAHNDSLDSDGYNVYLDRPAFFQPASALPGPTRPLPASVVSPKVAAALTPDNRTRPVPPYAVFSAAGAPPALAAQMAVARPAPLRLPQPLAAPLAALAAAQRAQPATTPTAPLPGAQPAGAAAATVVPASAAGAAASTAAAQTTPQAAQPAAALPQALPTTATTSPGVPAATPAASLLATSVSSEAAAGGLPQQQVVGRRLLSMQLAAAHVAGVLEHVGPADEAVLQRPWMLQQAGSGSPEAPAAAAGHHRAHDDDQHAQASTPGSFGAAPARALLQLQDHLDAFRRGAIRAECAEVAARTWRPYALFNISDKINSDPRYQAVLSGGNVVGILSATTAALNGLRAPVQPQQPAEAAAAAAAVPPAGSG